MIISHVFHWIFIETSRISRRNDLIDRGTSKSSENPLSIGFAMGERRLLWSCYADFPIDIESAEKKQSKRESDGHVNDKRARSTPRKIDVMEKTIVAILIRTTKIPDGENLSFS